MQKVKLIKLKVENNTRHLKTTTFFYFLLLFTIVLVSCSSSGSNNSTNNLDSTKSKNPKAVSNEEIITLPAYLNEAYIDKDTLKSILNENPRPRKLVFVPSIRSDSGLTLTGWVQKNGASHGPTYIRKFQLRFGDAVSSPTMDSISNLSSVEIVPPSINSLKAYIDTTQYSFIVFKPIVLYILGARVISYELHASQTPHLNSVQKFSDPLRNVTTNPSPPRNAY